MADKPVSIIVPIYNAKDNLGRCLDSITEQTLRDIEIILIDDGSDDGSQSVCDSYANKDTRIKVVHTEHKGTANACNTGISLSKGKYIGFVCPNDWIEKEMYDSLYNQALRSEADVITSLFYLHKENEDPVLCDEMGLIDNYLLFNRILTDKFAIPNFYLKNHTLCCSIYNRSFLVNNKINFNPDKLSNQCLSFIFLVYCCMQRFYIYKASFYHHHISESKEKNYSYANDLLDEHLYISDIIEKLNISSDVSKIETAKSLFDIRKQLKNNCESFNERKNYLIKASTLFKKYVKFAEENAYLSRDDKKQLENYAQNPERTAFLNRHNLHMKILRFLINIQIKKRVTHIKIFNFPILFIKRTDEYRTCNLFKIPIKRIQKTSTETPGEIRTKYQYLGLPLLKRVDNREEIKFYIAGLRVYKKINIQAQLSAIVRRLNQIPNPAQISYLANISNIVALTHVKVFPQFKNSNIGKSVAIVASGPSMNHAPVINRCETIACNRTFGFFKDKDPTFIIAEDYNGVRDFFDEMIDRKSKILIGCYMSQSSYKLLSIPEQLVSEEKIYRYYTDRSLTIRAELEYNNLTSYGTIVHSALHFALYTNPDIIYLLGCDTSNSGYSNKNLVQVDMHPELLIEGYKKFRAFRDLQYPKTRIVSVNPIGLRGIFEDVYTEQFIDSQTDLEKAGLTIIKEI